MITVRTSVGSCTVTPTIFPDGTSQVWKLPDHVVAASRACIDWRFESERELIDIVSLSRLINPYCTLELNVPYLPYARQDKDVSNTSTFNLEVLAHILNGANFESITALDVHNVKRTEDLIDRFANQSPSRFHEHVLEQVKPDFIVFPDAGAAERYSSEPCFACRPVLVCDKVRDQLSGNIVGHKITDTASTSRTLAGKTFLIVDDICDGGATFISVAKLLRESYSPGDVALCVTHGIFSKSRSHLLENGINQLYTTDSLTRNGDGYHV